MNNKLYVSLQHILKWYTFEFFLAFFNVIIYSYGTSNNLVKAEYWLKKAQEVGNDTARGIMLLMEEGSILTETN